MDSSNVNYLGRKTALMSSLKAVLYQQLTMSNLVVLGHIGINEVKN